MGPCSPPLFIWLSLFCYIFYAYTKYVWYYPLVAKSNVYSVFHQFQTLVERQFSLKIKSVQIDWGGEYRKLSTFFQTVGIHHRLIFPHTYEQNGTVERRHRHLVETGLTLLGKCKAPFQFWNYYFETFVYLINCMPTPVLAHRSSFDCLFQRSPDYHFLRTFRCLCFPFLRPYNNHKLDFRSSSCVFFGYSSSHLSYRCFDIASHRIYISRHVRFHEHVFSELKTIILRPRQPKTANLVASAAANPASTRVLYSPSSEPLAFSDAGRYAVWHNAMCDEIAALRSNRTWSLVPCHPLMNVVGSRWVYRIKRRVDGSIEGYKARLVARGFTQQEGIDYSETFSPVIKQATVRLVFSIAVSRNWKIHQLDIHNVFLNGILTEEVYMKQPPSFVDSFLPSHVCKLHKLLYGLKQAPRAWYTRLSDFLLFIGFRASKVDNSLFILSDGSNIFYLMVCVDDILLTGSNSAMLHHLIQLLSSEFKLHDLGTVHYFLGIEVQSTGMGLMLRQYKYILDILTRAGMTSYKPVDTAVSPLKVTILPDNSLSDPTRFHQIMGALQYLTFTRPNICFAVNGVCQFMHAPTDSHWAAVKHILRYLKGTTSYGFHITRGSSFALHGFTDADWAGSIDDRKSTGSYLVFFGQTPIS